MLVQELALPGVKLITTRVFADERGFFRETFRKSLYPATEFVQDNHSFSRKGTIRGMHFQRMPGQAKLVSVICGTIYDVVVDIKKNSPTYKQWIGVYLDASSGEQLYIPVGFAHGFYVVSDEAHVSYKVSSEYDPVEEKGFRFDDPEVNIAWPEEARILSERDQSHPLLCEVAL